MSWWKRFWAALDWVARADFVGTLLSYIVDWKYWLFVLLSGGGGGMTFLWAVVKGRDPLDVWVLAVVVVAAIAIIVWVIVQLAERLRAYRVQLAGIPAAASVDEARPVAPTAYVLDHAPREPFADWTIRELFLHLWPYESADVEMWSDIGRQVRDRASTGQLKVWGREVSGESRLALTLIDQGYWKLAEFTYWFLAEDHQQAPHVYNDALLNRLEYADLQMNRAQALEIWPQSLDGQKTSLFEAARTAYSATEGTMYATMAERMDISKRATSQTERVLSAYASTMSRHATVWGCKEPSTTTRPQDLSNYSLELKENGFIARETYGTAVISNLMVSQRDLTAFIAKVKKFPDVPL